MKFITSKEIRPGDVISMGPTWLNTDRPPPPDGSYIKVTRVRRTATGHPCKDLPKTVIADYLLVLKVDISDDPYYIQVLDPSGMICFIASFGTAIIKHV